MKKSGPKQTIRNIEDIVEPFPIRKCNLQQSNIELAMQWYYPKNCGFGPEDFNYGSSVSAWWQCPKNKKHIWKAPIVRRNLQGDGCNQCRLNSFGIDLKNFGNVVKFFDKKKNPGINPHKLSLGQNVWWKCSKAKDHKWKAKIYPAHIQIDCFCPFCRGRRLSSTNNLSKHDDLSKEFHPTKNGTSKPKDFILGSTALVWWQCRKCKLHEWQAKILSRALYGNNCPFCSGKRFSKDRSVAALAPDLARQWHPTKNKKLKPSDVTMASTKIVWWKCKNGSDHEWSCPVYSRALEKSGCPCCSNFKLSKTNSLKTLYPQIAKELHPKKNNGLKAHQLVATSNKIVWWQCKNGHEWQRNIRVRTINNSSCPKCPGYRSKASSNPLSNYPEYASQFDINKNGLTPERVSAGTIKIYWWKCENGPDHEWQTSPVNRLRFAGKCPFCANLRFSTTNSLQRLYPTIAKEFDTKKNSTKASQIIARSQELVWWQCLNYSAHTWKTSVYNRTQRGTNCPSCNRGKRPSK